tara:strand:+ start:200 stop:376 length:177 start_codon:yes stop_codon:yes gene_type:complete
MNISEAQYIKNIITGKNDSINAVFDGQLIFVPLDPANRHYAEILKQVKEGTLTIKDAE